MRNFQVCCNTNVSCRRIRLRSLKGGEQNQMRKLCLLLVVMALPILGHATVLTFGPLCSGSCYTYIPDGYGGFNWRYSFSVIGNSFYMYSYGNTYGAPSGGAPATSRVRGWG